MLLPVFARSFGRVVRLVRGRVYLQPPRQRDWKQWSQLRHASRQFLVPWEPTWAYDSLTRSAFRRRVRVYAQEWRHGTGYSFFVFRRSDDRLLGGVTLSNVRRGVAQNGSLGYWIGETFARQGLMTEALAGVLDFAFDDLGLHRIEAACLPSNEASRAVLLKLGFAQEGFAREFLRINGAWQDHVLFAILRNDPRPAFGLEQEAAR